MEKIQKENENKKFENKKNDKIQKIKYFETIKKEKN